MCYQIIVNNVTNNNIAPRLELLRTDRDRRRGKVSAALGAAVEVGGTPSKQHCWTVLSTFVLACNCWFKLYRIMCCIVIVIVIIIIIIIITIIIIIIDTTIIYYYCLLALLLLVVLCFINSITSIIVSMFIISV